LTGLQSPTQRANGARQVLQGEWAHHAHREH